MAEVTGTAGGGKLHEAIDSGLVPEPELMTYNEWVKWRAGPGGRPAQRRGDPMTTPAQLEVRLWRETMGRLHGDDWRDVLDARRAAAVEAAEAEVGHGADSPGHPLPGTPAGTPADRRSEAGASGSSGPATAETLRAKVMKEFDHL